MIMVLRVSQILVFTAYRKKNLDLFKKIYQNTKNHTDGCKHFFMYHYERGLKYSNILFKTKVHKKIYTKLVLTTTKLNEVN